MRKQSLLWLGLMLGLVLILGGCAATGNNPSSAVAPPLPESYAPPAVQPAPIPQAQPAPAPQPAPQSIPIAYTVVGDEERAKLVANHMISQGYIAQAKIIKSRKKGVTITSAPKNSGAGIWIPVSDKVLKEGLCDDQMSLIRSLPKMKTVQVAPAGEPCSGPNCWGPNPKGTYMTLTPWNGVRFVLNNRPGASFSNVVSVKLEYQNANLRGWHYGYTGWGPTVVLRNPAVSFPEAKAQLDKMGPRIQAYFACILPLRQGQPGNPGDSCFEVEFDLTTGAVTKSDAPPNCQF